MKKVVSFLMAFALLFTSFSNVSFAETATRPEDGVTYEQPFAAGTGGSQQFRIPCLVGLDDGTIVAGCDARWNTYGDGGGLDTIVSYSKDYGKTWNYTFANYLGDNGNVWNGASTAFIDPAMATDGENVYLVADLYPAGYALNSANNPPIAGQNGLTEEGYLRLADVQAADADEDGTVSHQERCSANYDAYHLEKVSEDVEDDAECYYQIKNSEGTVLEGYSVDAYFNVKGEEVDTNLFLADSPFLTFPTDYLYMTKSVDGGATWSIPTLLNVKRESEQSLLVGPGNGLVTSEGRVIFTVYEYTGGDKNSAVIYSDDGGVTWQRGASVSGWSSEATVTQVGNKLYIFTRHGRAYYVSDDWGATWSEQKSTGLSYNDNCQLSIITYSKKIDGKPAIIFSAPTDTGTRAAGKIFVGLVQDDDSIDWAYEYSINGNGFYAYSCLAELADGTIGLLYESASSSITYKNYNIAEIAKGAVISDFWLTDAEGEVVNSLVMGTGESVTLNVYPADKTEVIEVTTSKESVLTATIENNVVTLTSADDIGNDFRVEVTVTDGTDTFSIPVHLTDEENYEVVNLRMGDTVTYEDESGRYADTDLSGVNQEVVDVEILVGEEITYPYSTAKLATATATFDGEEVGIEDCLFTFTADGTTENSYVISHTTEDGGKIYLSHNTNTKGPGYPCNTTESAVTITSGNEMFALNNNGSYLFFWKEDSQKLHFDKQTELDGENYYRTYFELYTPSENAAADSPIAGYTKLTDLSQIGSGQQYLIVAKDINNNYYALYPIADGEKYNYIAKVVTYTQAPSQLGVQLASAEQNFDVAELKKISDCLFTFTSTGESNKYTISSQTAEGTTVYMNHRTAATSGIPCTTNSAVITVGTDSTNYPESFSFEDNTTSSNGKYLYFHKNGSLRYDRDGGLGVNTYFELYQPSETAAGNSPIAGYTKVTSVAEIKDGGQYLVASTDGNGNYYFLYPSTGGNRYQHVAKLTNTLIYEEAEISGTQIMFTGVGEGQTSVKVGNVTYYVIVKNEEENLTIKKGERISISGSLQKVEENQSVISIEDVDTLAPYVTVNDITDGKYLLGSNSHIIINEASSSTSPKGLAMKAADYANGDYREYVWKVTSVNNGYTIQDVNDKYINFTEQSGSQCSVVISDSAQTLGITKRSDGSFGVSYGSHYINNFSNSNSNAAGWADNNNAWYFYRASEGIEVKGLAEGTTVITVNGVNYNITVSGVADADYRKVDAALAKVPKDLESYTEESVAELQTAIDAVVRGKDYTQQSVVDEYAVAIETAIANLLDLTALQAEIINAENAGYVKEDYLAKSWTVYETALSSAKTHLENYAGKKQSEIDEIQAALVNAIANLSPKPVYEHPVVVEYLLQTKAIEAGDVLAIYTNTGNGNSENRILYARGGSNTDKVTGTPSADFSRLTLNSGFAKETQLWKVVAMEDGQIALQSLYTDSGNRYLDLTIATSNNLKLSETPKAVEITALETAGHFTISSAEENGFSLNYTPESGAFKAVLDSATPISIYKQTEVEAKLADAKSPTGVTEGQPFATGTGGSSNFRIPAMITLSDGTIVAAADARWNHSRDACSIDIMVSRSKDNGATWEYSLPAYFNDSTNAKHTYGACFIDPVMVRDANDRIYMMVDLFPGGIAINTAPKRPDAASGFVEIEGEKRLVLYNTANPDEQDDNNYVYYVGDYGTDNLAPIYEVTGENTYSDTADFYMDRSFYLYTAEKEKMYCPQLGNESMIVQQNVFFYNALLHVRCATYLCLYTSDDGGETWNAPMLLNSQIRKEENNDIFYGVGPGAGLWIDDGTEYGTVMLPAYTHSSEKSSFIYSTDGGTTWKRSEEATSSFWSSESCLVQLDNTTVRHFYRSGSNMLQYTDHTLVDGEWKAGDAVTMDNVVRKYNNQVSAIRYSKTIEDKPVILFSTATVGGAYDRKNGKIYVFVVDLETEGKPMTLVATYDNDPSSESDIYAYSSITEQADGSIGLLYEYDDTQDACKITYKNIPISELAPGIQFNVEDNITLTGNLNKNYDGQPVDLTRLIVNKQGREGEVTFRFYADAECNDLLTEIPKDLGTYWVKAVMAATENLPESTSDALEFTISKAKLSVKDISVEINQIKDKYETSITEFTFRGLAEGHNLVMNEDYTVDVELAGEVSDTTVDVILTISLKDTAATSVYELKENVVQMEAKVSKLGLKGIWVAGIEDLTYNGAKQTQKFSVYDGNVLLEEGKDYTVSYKNNQNVYECSDENWDAYLEVIEQGSDAVNNSANKTEIKKFMSKAPQVILKMKGNYQKNQTIYFKIQPVSIAEGGGCVVEQLSAEYKANKKQDPKPVVSWKGKTLKNKKDYTFAVTEFAGEDKVCKEAGTYKVTLTGKGNFTGERTVNYVITDSLTAMSKVKVDKIKPVVWEESFETEGAKPTVTVTFNREPLTENEDYTVEYKENKAVGTAYAVITAKEGSHYVGSKVVSFKINGTAMSKVKVEGIDKQNGYPYTGDKVTLPMESLKIYYKTGTAETKLTTEDYEVSYQKNVKKGTATMILTGKEERGYTGTKKESFKIVPRTLQAAEISVALKGREQTEGIWQVPFMKGGNKPEVVVMDGNTELLLGTDYTVSYKNNKNVDDTATLTIKGKGNYKDSTTLNFTVVQKDVEVYKDAVVVKAADLVVKANKKYGWKQTFKVYDEDGKALSKKEADLSNAVYTIQSLPEGVTEVEGFETGSVLNLNGAAEKTLTLPVGTKIQIKVELTGDNYKGEVVGTYRILEAGHDISKAKLELNVQEYTGNEILIEKDSQFKKAFVKNGKDELPLHIEKYVDNDGAEQLPNMEVVPGSYVKNVNKGTAKVTLRGINGFGGEKTVTFKIGQRSILDYFNDVFNNWF